MKEEEYLSLKESILKSHPDNFWMGTSSIITTQVLSIISNVQIGTLQTKIIVEPETYGCIHCSFNAMDRLQNQPFILLDSECPKNHLFVFSGNDPVDGGYGVVVMHSWATGLDMSEADFAKPRQILLSRIKSWINNVLSWK